MIKYYNQFSTFYNFFSFLSGNFEAKFKDELKKVIG